MDSRSETYSIHSTSLRDETKDKFDALLKAARRNNRKKSRHKSASKEQLLGDAESDLGSCTTASSGNLLDKDEETIPKDNKDKVNTTYVMNKFLEHQKQGDEIGEVVETAKPPVPKPRTRRYISDKDDNEKPPSHSPSISQRTFDVDVKSPVMSRPNFSRKSYGSGDSSNETGGDLSIHHEKRSTVGGKTNKFVEKGDFETLSDRTEESDTSSTSKSDRATFIKSNSLSRDKDPESEVIEMENLDSHPVIEFISEKPKKRRKKKVGKTKMLQNLDSVYDYKKIIEIIIHKTDKLLLTSLVIHPVVKIHIVDMETGKYLLKSDKSRSVLFFYENKDIDYISPIMTHAYNLQKQRSLIPSWEETIVVNEDYNYLVQQAKRIILFFEVLDFAAPSTEPVMVHQGWYNIAFAFLQLSGKNDTLNLGSQLRLQLYFYDKRSQSTGLFRRKSKKKSQHDTCDIWSYWKMKQYEKYPSTLNVTIQSVISPSVVIDAMRSKTPYQKEDRSSSFLDIFNHSDTQNGLETRVGKDDITKNDPDSKPKQMWSRSSPNEICKIPNECLATINSYDEGCFVLKFSHSGKFLASGVRCDDLFYVTVISVLSLREAYKFSCHQGLIYDIKWSFDDNFILSSSADNTVSVINLGTSQFQILPHPSFVYCCDVSKSNNIIASGCFDGTVRLWTSDNENLSNEDGLFFNLFQELEGHPDGAFVTCVCFNDKQGTLLSTDSLGFIKEWRVGKNVRGKFERDILLLDLRADVVINQVIVFGKNDKKLLVNTRDSLIRIVDLKSCCVLNWLKGALNERMQIFCTISACGTYVFSGSEDGVLHVWSTKTGRTVATYHNTFSTSYSSNFSIHCVDFHPLDNVIAIAHYGQGFPILLYSRSSDGVNKVDLQILEPQDAGLTSAKRDRIIEPIKKLEDTGGGDNNLGGGTGKCGFKDILRKMDQVIVPKSVKDSNRILIK